MAESDIVFLDAADDVSFIDGDAAAPRGEPCRACGSPIEADDSFCPACGVTRESSIVEAGRPAREETPTAEETTTVVDAPAHKFFRCDSCGSEVATDPDQRSYVCPFCDSTYVVEFSPDQSSRQPPEFVIGFAITPDQALEIFRRWIAENAWFRPSDLKAQAFAEKQKGVYLPFWSFSMLAESRWSASVGEYWYRTETYVTRDSKGKMVTKTRRVRETEWWPLDGHHHRYYSGYLISGSRGLPQKDAERIKPFNLPAMKRYQPYFLAGWLCEEYSVEREEAMRRSKEEFHRREQNNVASFLPGDTYSQLQVQTHFSDISSDLCLLPIYVLSYRYKKKLYRFLVNGQTGKAAGDKPISWARIALTVFGVLGGILLIVLVFGLLSSLF